LLVADGNLTPLTLAAGPNAGKVPNIVLLAVNLLTALLPTIVSAVPVPTPFIASFQGDS
jgi:hypothetical protein